MDRLVCGARPCLHPFSFLPGQTLAPTQPVPEYRHCTKHIPTRLHVWLITLGVQVRFTRKRWSTDHAIIECTHQTMTAQALLGQAYSSHSALWAGLDERREVLNRHLPSRVLSHNPPLETYPQAIHSGRSYRPECEAELLFLEKVCTYLAQGSWFRGIRTNDCFDLGHYAGAHPRHHESRVDGRTCGHASLANLPISPPIFVGGFATIGVHSYLDRYDFVRLHGK